MIRPKTFFKHSQFKAVSIRAIIMDVDGVLSDGKLYYGEDGTEIKAFSVRDGLILSKLRSLGFIYGVISGRSSEALRRRVDELDMDFCFEDVQNKLESYEEIKSEFQLQDSEIAYIGDDLNDWTLLSRCGFSACPANAPEYLQKNVDYVCTLEGGNGAVREWIEVILKAQDRLHELFELYEGATPLSQV